jgi:hypothetical protein
MPDTTAHGAGYAFDCDFGRVQRGELRADDHVELLDGVIGAQPPRERRHASAPRVAAQRCSAVSVARRGESIGVLAFPDARIAVAAVPPTLAGRGARKN